MRVREFLGKFFNESEVGDEDNIFQQGLVNSLFAMQLVNFVEKEFEVSVENDELDIENFKSISAISKFINSKM
jgi:methoxymalonate biosynthesis acyl carrier protein